MPNPYSKLRQILLASGYALKGKRPLNGFGFVAMAIEKLFAAPRRDGFLRAPNRAYRLPDGLVDMGGALSRGRLIAAYRLGVFPWRHLPPLKWWSPSRRAVLFLEESRIEKNLRRTLRHQKLKVTFDRAFRDVMIACSKPRDGHVPLTWITEAFIKAYCDLHRAGHAHSVEAWDQDGRLVGGLYGVASGNTFFTESQFANERDASKVAFVTLNRHLLEWGYRLNDGKFMTGHLANLGMREIPREEFLAVLAEEPHTLGPSAPWSVDESLDVANWTPSARAAA